jgi:hypothetical protein
MENRNKLCLYISYYLSRFNRAGYENLGFTQMSKAHAEIGRILQINPNTVKNMRDEFDPLHGFRAGWYQKPLSASRLMVVEAMQMLEEFQVRTIALKILRNPILDSENIISLLQIISDQSDWDEKNGRRTFILRAPTGKKAEEFFIEYYNKFRMPVLGELLDTREYGTGYDFKIYTGGEDHFIEVKGLAGFTGGVLFTGKEWEMALKYRERYHLVLVTGLDHLPIVTIITNPQSKLKVIEQIIKTIQVNFAVPAHQISAHLNS